MFESKMTWKKLKIELDLLNTECPTSLLPLIMGTNSYLMPGEPFDKIYQQLSYMNYEIANLCDNLSEEDRLVILNDYFFSKKGFSTELTQPHYKNPDSLLINSFFQLRQGHPILVSIAYSHFAAQLDLPIYITSTQMPHILKWVRSQGRTTFIDTLANGKLLNLNDILELYNRNPKKSPQQSFEILPAKNILSNYLDELYTQYCSTLCNFSSIDILNILIGLHPSHLKYLSARALAHKENGDYKSALSDLKRYFSFIDRASASPPLKMAYYELQALCTAPSDHNIGILH